MRTAETPSQTIASSDPSTQHHSLRCERVVLTGFMGAGKTTVGRLLADRLQWTFSDLDDRLEDLAGASIPSIFSAHGEAHMRHLETRALARALGRPSTVLALGGGALETLANRLLLEQTTRTVVVFLAAPFPTLYDRCMLQALDPATTARPNLIDPAAAQARFNARAVFYTRVAHHTADVDSLPPAAVVDHILTLLPRA